jgi:phosphoribosylamine--glycine ligase
MRVLVIGSGGREHAIIKALSLDARIDGLFVLPGNGGMTEAVCLPGDPMDNAAVLVTAKQYNIDFCVVTPDDPLANGLVDALEEGGIACFGPNKAAARIESSKVFAKELMRKYHIPTAAWQVAEDLESGLSYSRTQRYPLVIKADGLAKGKGVFIAEDVSQAEAALQGIFTDRLFGQSGSRAVIEEYLQGPEISVLVMTDGEVLIELPSAMDHKRALDGDLGPNTGGMGAIAPNPFYTRDIAQRCCEEIYLPTLRAMAQEGFPFRGCLYFGLMLTQDGPKVLEYNARFGDPETQAILMLLENSPLDAFLHTRNGGLSYNDLHFSMGSACCVVLASAGYPGNFEIGFPIKEENQTGVICYAGVKRVHDQLVTAGGRVAAACARANTLQGAIAGAYSAAEGLRFNGRFMRRDIGQSALNPGKAE